MGVPLRCAPAVLLALLTVIARMSRKVALAALIGITLPHSIRYAHGACHATAISISGVSVPVRSGRDAEAQFYGAMKRKGWPADPKDMQSIVAIHNGVNERAWHQILRYEVRVRDFDVFNKN